MRLEGGDRSPAEGGKDRAGRPQVMIRAAIAPSVPIVSLGPPAAIETCAKNNFRINEKSRMPGR
jgi:hypothetical protein